jgi:hypothetical protein
LEGAGSIASDAAAVTVIGSASPSLGRSIDIYGSRCQGTMA